MERTKRQQHASTEPLHVRAFGSGPSGPTRSPLSKMNKYGTNMSMSLPRTARTDERGSKINAHAILRRQHSSLLIAPTTHTYQSYTNMSANLHRGNNLKGNANHTEINTHHHIASIPNNVNNTYKIPGRHNHCNSMELLTCSDFHVEREKRAKERLQKRTASYQMSPPLYHGHVQSTTRPPTPERKRPTNQKRRLEKLFDATPMFASLKHLTNKIGYVAGTQPKGRVRNMNNEHLPFELPYRPIINGQTSVELNRSQNYSYEISREAQSRNNNRPPTCSELETNDLRATMNLHPLECTTKNEEQNKKYEEDITQYEQYIKNEECRQVTKGCKRPNNRIVPYDTYVEQYIAAKTQTPVRRRKNPQPVQHTTDLTLQMVTANNEPQVGERNQARSPLRTASDLHYSSSDAKSTPASVEPDALQPFLTPADALQPFLTPASDQTPNVRPFLPDGSPSAIPFLIMHDPTTPDQKDLTAAQEALLYKVGELSNSLACDLKLADDDEPLLNNGWGTLPDEMKELQK